MGDSASPLSTPSKREGEKQELRELNKRLEYYIIRQRQREAEADALTRELAEAKAQYERELALLKGQHEKEITAAQAHRQVLLDENSRLVEANSRQENMIGALSKELADQEKARAALNKRLEQSVGEIQDLKTRAFAAEEKARQQAEDLHRLHTELQAAKVEIESLRRRLDDATARAASAEERLRKLEADYAREVSESRRITAEREAMIAEYQAARAGLEDEFQRRLTEELEKMVRERHAQFEREKEDIIKELKEQMAQTDTIAGLQARIRELEGEVAKLLGYATANRDLDRELADVKLRIIEKEKTIDSLHVSHSLEIRSLRDRIDALSRELAEKEKLLSKQGQDYDKLHDVKVALDLEIKAYRLLLENEEDRHRSKRTRGPTTAPRLSPFSSPLTTSTTAPLTTSFAISDIDLEQGFIEITNDGPSAASLTGWSLRSTNAKHSFIMPDENLARGGTLRVYLYATSAPVGAHLWKSKDGQPVCDQKGDEIQLVDSEGNTATQVQIVEEGEQDGHDI